MTGYDDLGPQRFVKRLTDEPRFSPRARPSVSVDQFVRRRTVANESYFSTLSRAG